MRHMCLHIYETNVSVTTSWQKPETGTTWTWRAAANNDALYIASSVTQLSSLRSPFSSLLIIAHEAIIRSWKGTEWGAGALDTWDKLGACRERYLIPAPVIISQSDTSVATSWPMRGQAEHMSQSSEGVSHGMSQCAKLGHREGIQKSTLLFHEPGVQRDTCNTRNCQGEISMTYVWHSPPPFPFYTLSVLPLFRMYRLQETIVLD